MNWLGLAAGVVTLVMLAVSFYQPWWQLTIGQGLIKINASPVNTNFGLFGTQITIPLIWALNVVMILTFAASGIIMLIYSVMPMKPYSKHLLSFSWKKPLYAIISFIAGLIIILLLVGHFGLYLPINGSALVKLPSNLTPDGTTVSASVTGAFQITFWLAVVAMGLCIGARILHGEMFTSEKSAPSPAPSG